MHNRLGNADLNLGTMGRVATKATSFISYLKCTLKKIYTMINCAMARTKCVKFFRTNLFIFFPIHLTHVTTAAFAARASIEFRVTIRNEIAIYRSVEIWISASEFSRFFSDAEEILWLGYGGSVNWHKFFEAINID